MAEETRLPADIDAQPLVQAAAALQPALRDYHDEIEREQRLPQALVEQLREAGFYKMVIPGVLGGLQVDPLTYLRVVELLAEGAGSVGWNLANNSIGQLVTLGLPDEGVREIYSRGADTIIAGTAVPGAVRRRRSRAATGSAGAGNSAAAARRAPGCWAAFKFLTTASRAAARMAARSIGAGCFPERKRRSCRGAGTSPDCAAPAVSTGRSRMSSCPSGGQCRKSASRSTISGSVGQG